MADNVSTQTAALATVPDTTKIATDQLADGSHAQKMKVLDGTADGTNALIVSAAGAAKVDGSAVTQPVSGTFFQATQPVSGTVTANAGTGPFPVSDNAGSLTVDAPIGTPVWVRESDGAAAYVGQKTMANSKPVVIASDQTAIPASQSGTWTVAGGANVFHVDDNAGSLTVDAPVGTPVFSRLSDGAAALIGQKAMTASLPVVVASDQSALTVASHAVTNAGTFAVQDSEKVVDNAAFTDGTTKVLPAGFIFDESAGTALTENDAAAGRVNANRAQVAVLEDETTRGRRTTVTAANALKVDNSAVTQPVSGTVDTELPAAAALSDTTANPTAPMVGAAEMVWNGTDWRRAKQAPATVAPAITSTGLPAVAMTVARNADDYRQLASPALTGDGTDGANSASVTANLWNGATYDRQHGNWRTTTGDTGAKTVTFAGATQTNFDSAGALILVQLGTVSGTTPTLACQLQWSFDAGTTWLSYGAVLPNLTASSQTGAIMVYPTTLGNLTGASPQVTNGLTLGATVNITTNAPLPRTWRINYTIAGTTPNFAITAVHVIYMT